MNDLDDTDFDSGLAAHLQALSFGGMACGADGNRTETKDAEAMSTAAGSGYGGSTAGNKSRRDRKKATVQRDRETQQSKTEIYAKHIRKLDATIDRLGRARSTAVVYMCTARAMLKNERRRGVYSAIVTMKTLGLTFR